MALTRILIDGYSLLHSWQELAPGKPRHAMAARDELVWALRQYHDVTGTPISVFFDGVGLQTGPSTTRSTPQVEILYSKAGQTADQMIERTTKRLLPYGEVLVITNDHAERDFVTGLGAMAASCDWFIADWNGLRRELQRDIKSHNLRERNRFKRSP